MDLSKLPKLSQRPAETPSQTPPDLARPVEPIPVGAIPGAANPAQPGPPGMPAAAIPQPASPHPANPYAMGKIGFFETWLCVGIGLFILWYSPRCTQWVSSRVFHTHFDPFVIHKPSIDPDTGEDVGTDEEVPYYKVPEFKSDLGPTLLGASLIIDGLLFLTKRKTPVRIAFGITVLSTGYNLYWLVHEMAAGALPVLSFMAVLFGGMILGTQWMALRSFSSNDRGGSSAMA